MVLDTRDRAGKKTNFLPLWWEQSNGKRGNTNEQMACCSVKGQGKEGDGETANLDEWSRKVFLTR